LSPGFLVLYVFLHFQQLAAVATASPEPEPEAARI
jgi:hypothetical protein